MEEEKIVLDRKSFEALAVDTRVRILKALKQRRKTLSELSEELGLAVSGVKEHLETLQSAELITKVDDGHKWKYYELTRKGSEIIGPKELRVWILLSISTLALILSAMSMFQVVQPWDQAGGVEMSAAPPALGAQSDGAENAPQVTAADSYMAGGNCTGDAPGEPGNCSAPPSLPIRTPVVSPQPGEAPPEPKIQNTEPETRTPGPGTSPVPLATAAISGLAMLACLAVLAKNRLARP